MKKSGLVIVTLLLSILLAGLLICLSFANKKHQSRSKLVVIPLVRLVSVC